MPLVPPVTTITLSVSSIIASHPDLDRPKLAIGARPR
jgi:hypothetical protein